MAKASLSNEDIVEALRNFGECHCAVYQIKDVGRSFDCPEHGKGVVTNVEITSFGSREAEMLITVRFHA